MKGRVLFAMNALLLHAAVTYSKRRRRRHTSCEHVFLDRREGSQGLTTDRLASRIGGGNPEAHPGWW